MSEQIKMIFVGLLWLMTLLGFVGLVLFAIAFWPVALIVGIIVLTVRDNMKK